MDSVLDTRRVDTYAHTLFEAALSEDRVFEDQHALSVIANASPEVVSFLRSMLEQNDYDLLEDVVRSYDSLVRENKLAAGTHIESVESDAQKLMSSEVVGVHVTTAIPLDDELRAIVTNRCEADLHSKVFLIEHVDPTIIGGIVLSARGHHRDASIKTQLDKARKVLTHQSFEKGGATGA